MTETRDPREALEAVKWFGRVVVVLPLALLLLRSLKR